MRDRTSLSQPVRRQIVLLIQQAGELSAGEIADRLARGRPTVSHHLTRLLLENVIRVRQDGSRRFYSIDERGALAAWDAYLREVTE